MSAPSQGQMRVAFYAIEVNLLLWLVVAGRIWTSEVDTITKYMTGAGFIASALLQHWGYYHLVGKASASAHSAQQPPPRC